MATTAFFVLRMARYTFKEAKVKPTIVEMVPEAFKIFQNRERLYLAEQMHENISTRSFVLEYLATLSERTDVIPPAYGENLVRATVRCNAIHFILGKIQESVVCIRGRYSQSAFWHAHLGCFQYHTNCQCWGFW